jgi:hypothetical protein
MPNNILFTPYRKEITDSHLTFSVLLCERHYNIYVNASHPVVRLNNILKFSPYREGNTALHRYKDQPVNAV